MPSSTLDALPGRQTLAAETGEASLRVALEWVVLESLCPISVVLGIYYVLLSVSHVLLLPADVAPFMATVAAIWAVFYLAAWLVLRKWTSPTRRVHLLLTVFAMLMSIHNLLHLYLAAEPQQTTHLMIVILAAGLVFLSTPWFVTFLLSALLGWGVVVALLSPSSEWLHFGLALFFSTLLALVAHSIRLRSVRRQEWLCLENARQSQDIERNARQMEPRVETSPGVASVQPQRRLAETLYNVGRVLSRTLDLQEVLDLILEQLAFIVSYDRASILLRDGGEMEIVGARGFPDSVSPVSLRIPIQDQGNEDVFLEILRTQQPLVIADVIQYSNWHHVEGALPARSWMGVPLSQADQVVGMLSLVRDTFDPYTEQDVTFAMAFAGQAMIALQSAQLYDRVKRFNLELEETVTERTAVLLDAYDQLEKMDRAKTDFIYVASHELRTPLTVLFGYSQLLLGDEKIKADPTYLSLVSGIHAGAVRLHEIIDSLLDIARIESHTMEIHPRPLSIAGEIGDLVVKFEGTLSERQLGLTLEGLDGLPGIEADPEALGKVFYHLLSNAIKYTPDGSEIRISGHRYVEGGINAIEIIVSDSGIGIDPSKQDLVFAKFYQTGKVELHSSSSTKFKGGGAGLGLAIARGIVEAHHGSIWVESPGFDEEKCLGSDFHVVLPLKQPED